MEFDFSQNCNFATFKRLPKNLQSNQPKVYLELSQTSTMDLCSENNFRKKAAS